MEARRSILRSALRWSIALVCAALLWFFGYRSGREAGSARGTDEGFAVARAEGLSVGRIEGIRQSMGDRPGAKPSNDVHEVAELLDRRLAPNFPAGSAPEEEVRREAKALMQEVLTELFPEMNGEVDGPDFSIRYMPGNRTFIVHTDAERQMTLRVYLKSPEDYRAWKQHQEKEAAADASAQSADRTSSAR